MSKHLAVAILIVPVAFALAGSFQPETFEPPVAVLHEEGQPLAIALDLSRGRRWEMRWDEIIARDIASGEVERRIRLPGATLAGARDSSLPGMVLGRSGALYVSSNVQPRLWRVSPSRFEVEIYDIELAQDTGKDVGFADLAWEANESTLRAKGAPEGTAWRIELHSATASRLAAITAVTSHDSDRGR